MGSCSVYRGFGKWLPTQSELYNYAIHFIGFSFYYVSPLKKNGGYFGCEYCYIKSSNLFVLTSLAPLENFKRFSNSESSFVSLHLRSPDVLSPITFQGTYKIILTLKIKIWNAKSIKDKWGSQKF